MRPNVQKKSKHDLDWTLIDLNKMKSLIKPFQFLKC